MDISQRILSVYQIFYKIQKFFFLYSLGFKYSFIEANRKLQWFSKIKHLDFDLDLPSNLNNVSVVITGGSRGIGLETINVLIKKGAHVNIITSKKEEDFEKLKLELKKKFENYIGTFELSYADFTDLDSVVDFLNNFYKYKKKVNVLINNAGIMFAPKQITKDGFELHLQTNYLGHCLLTFGLMPVLQKSNLILDNVNFKPRIVNVSSSTHFCTNLNFDDLNHSKLYSSHQAYAQSKLAQIMFGYYLSKKNTDIVINNLHPGVVLTDLYKYVFWVNLFPKLAKLIFRNPKEGSETVLYCAISTTIKNDTGLYFEDSDVKKSSSYSYEENDQKKLYNYTQDVLKPWLLKLNFSKN